MNPLRIFLLAALVLVVFGIGNAEAKESKWDYTSDAISRSVAISSDGNYEVSGHWDGRVVFFQTSITDFNTNAEVIIKLNHYDLKDRENNLIEDLNSITSVGSVDISSDTEVIVLEVDNQIFDADPVKKTLDKWEVDYEKEFGVSVIADADEY